jgi:hypothetical protein
MTRNLPTQASLSLLAGWAFVSIASYLLSEVEIVFRFAYFVLPISALFVPLLVATAATGMMRNRVHAKPIGQRGLRHFFHSFWAAVVGVTGYLLCAIVVARFMELPWRLGKCGESSLSLGKTTAMFFYVVAGAVLLAAWCLGRVSAPESRYRLHAKASIAMVLFACGLYFVIGATPLVAWRS